MNHCISCGDWVKDNLMRCQQCFDEKAGVGGRYPKNEAIPNKSDSGEGRSWESKWKVAHSLYLSERDERIKLTKRLALLERVLEAAREAISGPNRSANLSRLAEAIEAADGTGDGK